MEPEYPHHKSSISPASTTEKMDEKNVGIETSENGPILTAEEAELARLGYKQEFKREFTWMSTFSFAFSISGLLATVTTTLGYPLNAGGPPGVVWCWLIGGLGCMCIACSVGELVSAYPVCRIAEDVTEFRLLVVYISRLKYLVLVRWQLTLVPRSQTSSSCRRMVYRLA